MSLNQSFISDFTVIYSAAITILDAKIEYVLHWKESPYLGPQSPCQKLQIFLFESKKRSQSCMNVAF